MIFDDLENYGLYEEEYDDTDFYFDDFDLSNLSAEDKAEVDRLFNGLRYVIQQSAAKNLTF